MGHSELFEILSNEAGRGAVHLKTYLGTYLAILYDGTAYQSTRVCPPMAAQRSCPHSAHSRTALAATRASSPTHGDGTTRPCAPPGRFPIPSQRGQYETFVLTERAGRNVTLKSSRGTYIHALNEATRRKHFAGDIEAFTLNSRPMQAPPPPPLQSSPARRLHSSPAPPLLASPRSSTTDHPLSARTITLMCNLHSCAISSHHNSHVQSSFMCNQLAP